MPLALNFVPKSAVVFYSFGNFSAFWAKFQRSVYLFRVHVELAVRNLYACFLQAVLNRADYGTADIGAVVRLAEKK